MAETAERTVEKEVKGSGLTLETAPKAAAEPHGWCWLVGWLTPQQHASVSQLRDGSTQTMLRAATLR